jgi:hypothetical protein
MSNAALWAIAYVAGEYSPYRIATVNRNLLLRRTSGRPDARLCGRLRAAKGDGLRNPKANREQRFGTMTILRNRTRTPLTLQQVLRGRFVRD